MKDCRIIIFLLSIIIGSTASYAQESFNEAKELATSAESYRDFQTAIYYWKKALEKKPNQYDITASIAENYRALRDYKQALIWYDKTISHPKHKPSLVDFYYGSMLKTADSCDLAIKVLNQFRKDYRGKKDDLLYMRWAKNQIKSCNGEILMKEKEKLKLKAVQGAINTSHMESSPVFIDDSTIIYSAIRLDGQNSFDVEGDDIPHYQFYWAVFSNDEWQFKGKWKGIDQNPNWHYTSAAMNMEKSRFYFTICKSEGKTVDCNIYVKDKDGIKQLPESVNSKYTETQPAVGKDYKDREVLYFVSDRKDGKGGKDIWYTTYYEKKKAYKEARNAGSKINSIGDELSPFIHPRTRTLYFASNGHPGLGQLDIFQSLGERSKWEAPENLGETFNSNYDDLYFAEAYDNKLGFIVSNRSPKESSDYKCCDDLLTYRRFENKTTSLKGKILSDDGKNVPDAKLKVFLLEGDSVKVLQQTVKTDDLGNYKIVLEKESEYRIEVEKKGYLVGAKTINTKYANTLSSNFTIEGVENKAFILENVYYKFDRSELTNEAMITIDTTLLPVMIDNPLIIIELSSHTDSKGTKGYNEKLSQDRAESVVKYLRTKGIAKNRMVAKGYGFSKPIAPNINKDGSDNPEGRAKNRRTEFKIIGELEESDLD